MPPTGEQQDTQANSEINRPIDKNTLIVGDLNTPLSEIDRTPMQKNRQRTKGFECHIRRVGPHRYI